MYFSNICYVKNTLTQILKKKKKISVSSGQCNSIILYSLVTFIVTFSITCFLTLKCSLKTKSMYILKCRPHNSRENKPCNTLT